MKAKSPHGCLYIFVGNMYPTKWSILRKLKSNPNWIKFITGAINQKGESLWEELQPIAQLKREFQNDLAMGRPDVFYSEVLNDENASSNNLINLSKLPAYEFSDSEIAGAKYVIIDPATGKLGGDSVAIGYFEVYNGVPVLRHLTNERLSPGESIRKSLEYCLTYGANVVAIESVAYQSTLAYWFQFICQQMGIIGIEAVEIYPGGQSKNTRILNMLKSYMQGDIYVHPSCQPTVHLQITQFNPIKKDNIDDVLDLLWYAPKVIEMYGDYLASQNILQLESHSELEVWDDNSGF
jgi:hypothetical protein